MSFYERLRNNAPEITDTARARDYVHALTVVVRGLPAIPEREQLRSFIDNYKQRLSQQKSDIASLPAFEEVLPPDSS